MPNTYSLTPPVGIDDGLRSYMLKVYNYMAAALTVTAGVAFASAQSATFLNAMYVLDGGEPVGMRPLAWVVMFVPLALAVLAGFSLRSMGPVTTEIIYWSYAILIGLSLSVIFLTFTTESIGLVLVITAGMFGGMSLFGYITRRNLTGLGDFLSMALLGLIFAMIINVFFHSSALQFVLSIVGVLIFAALTAYDTQRLKSLYYDGQTGRVAAILGALTLYLDVINLFLNLLNLFGNRRR
jgi:uncharacterized protein